jgi:hypothetical protein
VHRSSFLPTNPGRSVPGRPPVRFSAPSALQARRVHFPEPEPGASSHAGRGRKGRPVRLPPGGGASSVPSRVRDPALRAQQPTNRSFFAEDRVVATIRFDGRRSHRSLRFCWSVPFRPAVRSGLLPCARLRFRPKPSSVRDVDTALVAAREPPSAPRHPERLPDRIRRSGRSCARAVVHALRHSEECGSALPSHRSERLAVRLSTRRSSRGEPRPTSSRRRDDTGSSRPRLAAPDRRGTCQGGLAEDASRRGSVDRDPRRCAGRHRAR